VLFDLVHQRAYAHAQQRRSVDKWDCQAVDHYSSTVSRIPHLFATCRPAAIIRGIRAVVVLAFNTVTDRAWSHILEERLETVQPAFAHCNTTCPVTLVARVARSSAASTGGIPDAVLRSQAPSVSSACALKIAIQATTASRQSITQALSHDDLADAAIAEAQPRNPSSRVRRSRYVLTLRHRQAAKTTSCQVVRGRHTRNYIKYLSNESGIW
jgi:hypothetical protein